MKSQYCAEILSKFSNLYYHETLQAAGFVRAEGCDYAWYRIHGELLQHIFAVSADAIYYPMVDVLFGSHPLFLSAPIPPSPFVRTIKDKYSDAVCRDSNLYLSHFYKTYFEFGEQVFVPNTPKMGLDIIEKLLPVLDAESTAEEAFERQKRELKKDYLSRSNRSKLSNLYFPAFIDQAIYVGDTSVLPDCLDNARAFLEFYETVQRKAFQQEHEMAVLRLAALQDGAVDAFMEHCKKACEKNRKVIAKKLGI